MQAVQAFTGGHGGWPMSVFLTPDLRPFFGGTYFPPQDRHGLPGFRTVLRFVADLYRDRRTDVEQTGAQVTDRAAADGGGRAGNRGPGSRGAGHGLRSPAAQLRCTRRRFRRRPEVPSCHGSRIPAALPHAHRRPRRASHGATHAPADGARRHLRSARRRVPPLLHRRAVAGAALREDALRQRALGTRLSRGLAGVRGAALPRGGHRHPRLRRRRDDQPRGRLLLGPGRRQRRRRGEVLRLDTGRDRRDRRARPMRASPAATGTSPSTATSSMERACSRYHAIPTSWRPSSGWDWRISSPAWRACAQRCSQNAPAGSRRPATTRSSWPGTG